MNDPGMNPGMSRRGFLKGLAAVTAAATLPLGAGSDDVAPETALARPETLPKPLWDLPVTEENPIAWLVFDDMRLPLMDYGWEIKGGVHQLLPVELGDYDFREYVRTQLEWSLDCTVSGRNVGASALQSACMSAAPKSVAIELPSGWIRCSGECYVVACETSYSPVRPTPVLHEFQMRGVGPLTVEA